MICMDGAAGKRVNTRIEQVFTLASDVRRQEASFTEAEFHQTILQPVQANKILHLCYSGRDISWDKFVSKSSPAQKS